MDTEARKTEEQRNAGLPPTAPIGNGGPPRRGNPLAVLQQRNFLLYWLGQLISLVGTWMQQLAQSWVVLSLTHTAVALGTVNFVGALPPALLLLYGGAIADRFSKRKILIVTQVFFMAGAFVFAWLLKTGALRYWHVLALAVILGFAQAFDLPASQAFVPELVERKDIPPAVQLNQAIFNGARVIGPPVAGVLIAAFGPFVAFVANGLSFIPVIGTLMVIRAVRPGERRGGGTLDAVKAGFAYVRTRPDLLTLMGITALTATLIFPNMAVLMPFYVKNVLGQNAGAMGAVMGFSGAGAFTGAMLLLITRPDQWVRRIAVGLCGMTLSLLVLGVAPGLHMGTVHHISVHLAVTCLATMFLGFSVASAQGLVSTIVQNSVPDDLRGRVTSLQTLVFIGIIPFAGLLMTKVVDMVTMPHEMIGAALLYAATAIYLYTHLKATHQEPAAPAH